MPTTPAARTWLLVGTCLLGSACGRLWFEERGFDAGNVDAAGFDSGIATTDGGTANDGGSSTDAGAVDAAFDAGGEEGDAGPPLPCDEGDRSVVDPSSGHCYSYFAGPLTWAEARTLCMGLTPPGHMATITSAEEQTLVQSLLSGGGVVDVWLGANDMATEMTWVWNTGEPLGYTNWRDREPNDRGGEDCMLIEADVGGTWDDRNCGNGLDAVCERE